VATILLLSCGGDGNASGGAETGPSAPAPSAVVVPVIGEIAPLPDGAVARVNGLRAGVTLPPGQPAPEPGMRLVRIDVELCAGEARLFVDSAFWLGLGEDDTVYSAHLGVRDLVTLTMAPGTCQRGTVDLAVAEGVGLRQVLLMDSTHTTVARWSAEGRPGPLQPLGSEVTPELAVIGSPTELTAGGSVTLHRVAPAAASSDRNAIGDGVLVRIDGEVCAGQREVHAGPRNWLVQLEDHRIVVPERTGSTMPTGPVDPNTCERGTADFSVPAGAEARAVIYTDGGIFEEARWRLPD